MKKIILSLGMSIDGYIARENGDVSWMSGDGSCPEELDIMTNVKKVIEETGIVVMGRKSYEVTSSFGKISETLPKAKRIIVLTSREINDPEIETFNGRVEELVNKYEDGIFIFGGSNVAKQFFDKDLVTDIDLGIVPKLLGKGISLWEELEVESKWKLRSLKKQDGIVMIRYIKKEKEYKMNTITFKGEEHALLGEVKVKKGEALTFKGVDKDGKVVNTEDFTGKKVISVFPKLNTSVCDNQNKVISNMIDEKQDVKFISVTTDEHGTINDWCENHGINNSIILSDKDHKDFETKTNLLITDLGLFARGFIILDEENKVVDFSFKKEITEDPDFDLIKNI